MNVEVYQAHHRLQICSLVNIHVSAVVPGLAVSEAYLERHLHANPGQYIIDPWVAERKTLVVLHRQRVMGAAHLLRYGTGETVGEHYRGAVDIAWFVFWPGHETLARELLDACHAQMDDWNATNRFAFDSHFPLPLYGGIADVWSHIESLFESAGYSSQGGGAVYGGTLDALTLPGEPPVAGVTMKRMIRNDNHGVSFVAMLDGNKIGWSEWVMDTTRGGDLPSMRGWGELVEQWVNEEWRNHGIGKWLIQHAAVWLRLAHIDRATLCVDMDDDAEGAGRFYNRCGWTPFAHFRDGWRRR